VPRFPTLEELFDLFVSELPPEMFAQDRADSTDPTQRSISSSDIRAQMTLTSNAYLNLLNIYSDKFISTLTTSGIIKWEKLLFAAAQDSTQTTDVRIANLLTQYRATGGINYVAIYNVVQAILGPSGLSFALVAWSGYNNGAWQLEIAGLDVGTYLSTIDPLLGVQSGYAPLDCSLNYAAANLTLQQAQDIQIVAYTYEVRIFGIADAGTLARLDNQLTKSEPARSTHIIMNDFPARPDGTLIDAGYFNSETLIDNINFGLFTALPATYSIWDLGDF
jgi:hypothetical protein